MRRRHCGTCSASARIRARPSPARQNEDMGLFQRQSEDQDQWAAIPGEPLDKDPADFLDEAAPSDLLGLGGASITIDITPEKS